jgi:hypothetical protein
MPPLATGAPSLVNPMLGHFHSWRGRNIDDLAAARSTDPAQAEMTVGTGDDPMFDDLGRQ